MTAQATHAELSRLLDPRGIAIVGASAELHRIGGQPIRALSEFGYQGRIYPVNPKYSEIKGLTCFPDVASVPQPCDVALICVPAKLVPDAIRQCGEAGIAFAVILSAGFREIGDKGMMLQAELDAAVRDSGVRVIGPNCQGMMGPKNDLYCGFGAPFMYRHTRSGRVAMVTQSGGFGFAVMGLSEAEGVGFNYVISTGNEADIGALELIDTFIERDDTDIVATYLEGVTDGRRLIETGCRALRANKPILVWKVGNSATGRRAAASHTANLTAGYELYRAAFRQGGYLEVGDVSDLVDLSRAFGLRRLPTGNNVAVISISGGAGVLLADRCEELGLALPSLSEATATELRALLPAFSSVANPIDVTAQVFNDFSVFNKVVNLVARDTEVHQLIVVTASVEGASADKLAQELVSVAAATDKPILVASSAPPSRADAAKKLLEDNLIPVYPTPGRAAMGAAALAEFAARRRKLLTATVQPRLVARQALELPAQRGTLGEHRSKQLLQAYGIPVVSEVLMAIDEIGALKQAPFAFPLAAKLESPDLPHKTEAGAVRVGLRSLDELKTSVHEMREAALRYKPDARIEGVLIQEMASGLEVIVGTTRDEFFGPTVVFGLGGIFTEVLRDVTHRFAPFDTATAHEMILEIKGVQLLRGYRGKPALDVDALADALSRLSLLAADHADAIAEIDINPLFVRSAGQGVVAADALVILR
jgi:acyl-CoA synthetase (NDP forming)